MPRNPIPHKVHTPEDFRHYSEEQRWAELFNRILGLEEALKELKEASAARKPKDNRNA